MPVKGTNRDKLNNTSIYDLLIKMNKEYIKLHPDGCIIELLDPQHDCDTVFPNGCSDCIQKWLNSR